MARRQRWCPRIFVLMHWVFATAFWVTLITAIKWHMFHPLTKYLAAAYAAAVLFGIAARKLRC